MRTVADDLRRSKVVHVRLTPWEKEELKEKAERERRTLSEWIRELIRKAID